MSARICFDAKRNNIHPEQQYSYNTYALQSSELDQFDCGSKAQEDLPEQQNFPVAKPMLKEVVAAADTHALFIGRALPNLQCRNKVYSHG